MLILLVTWFCCAFVPFFLKFAVAFTRRELNGGWQIHLEHLLHRWYCWRLLQCSLGNYVIFRHWKLFFKIELSFPPTITVTFLKWGPICKWSYSVFHSNDIKWYSFFYNLIEYHLKNTYLFWVLDVVRILSDSCYYW